MLHIYTYICNTHPPLAKVAPLIDSITIFPTCLTGSWFRIVSSYHPTSIYSVELKHVYMPINVKTLRIAVCFHFKILEDSTMSPMTYIHHSIPTFIPAPKTKNKTQLWTLAHIINVNYCIFKYIFSINISTSTHNAIYKTVFLSYSPPQKIHKIQIVGFSRVFPC